jgi:thioredoxin reductase (NADPH)
MRIVNPSFGTVPAGAETLKAGAVDWKRDPILLFSNSKPNAKELLEGLKGRFGSVRSTDGIDFVWKPSASQPATSEQIEGAARRYRAALLALGD